MKLKFDTTGIESKNQAAYFVINVIFSVSRTMPVYIVSDCLIFQYAGSRPGNIHIR